MTRRILVRAAPGRRTWRATARRRAARSWRLGRLSGGSAVGDSQRHRIRAAGPRRTPRPTSRRRACSDRVARSWSCCTSAARSRASASTCCSTCSPACARRGRDAPAHPRRRSVHRASSASARATSACCEAIHVLPFVDRATLGRRLPAQRARAAAVGSRRVRAADCRSARARHADGRERHPGAARDRQRRRDLLPGGRGDRRVGRRRSCGCCASARPTPRAGRRAATGGLARAADFSWAATPRASSTRYRAHRRSCSASAWQRCRRHDARAPRRQVLSAASGRDGARRRDAVPVEPRARRESRARVERLARDDRGSASTACTVTRVGTIGRRRLGAHRAGVRLVAAPDSRGPDRAPRAEPLGAAVVRDRASGRGAAGRSGTTATSSGRRCSTRSSTRRWRASSTAARGAIIVSSPALARHAAALAPYQDRMRVIPFGIDRRGVDRRRRRAAATAAGARPLRAVRGTSRPLQGRATC